MASTIRLKTKTKNNITTVRAIIRHPMETGFRISDETGELIPEHYIKEVLVKYRKNVIFSCDWSRAVSKNPYLSFKFKNSKIGEKIEISWFDSYGNTDSLTTIIE